MSQPIAVPMLSISPNSLYAYTSWEGGNKRYKPSQLSLNNLLNNKQVNGISEKTRVRIRKAVNWLVELSDYHWYKPVGCDYEFKVKVAFLTLTLPSKQRHCDKVITKECLNQYLVELRKYHNVKNYVWKAEAQENGNLHYHIAIDRPVDYDKARDRWNRIVNKLGYIDEFEKVNGHRNPNSTDIHKVKDVKNLSAYISEYMAKKEGRRLICGRDAGWSQTISRCENVKVMIDTKIGNEFESLRRNKKLRSKQLDYGFIIYGNSSEWMSSDANDLSLQWRRYIARAKREKLPSKKRVVEISETKVTQVNAMEDLAVRQLANDISNQVEQLKIFSDSEICSTQKASLPPSLRSVGRSALIAITKDSP